MFATQLGSFAWFLSKMLHKPLHLTPKIINRACSVVENFTKKNSYQKSALSVHVSRAPNTLQTAMPPLPQAIAIAQPSGVHEVDVTIPAFLPWSGKNRQKTLNSIKSKGGGKVVQKPLLSHGALLKHIRKHINH